MPRGSPSSVDAALIDHCRKLGLNVEVWQLERWRQKRARLLSIGIGDEIAPGTFELVEWLARNFKKGGRPHDLALRAFGEGLAVPDATIRKAFDLAIDRVVVPGEHPCPHGVEPDDWAAEVAAKALKEQKAATVIPRRVRSIDAKLTALGVDWAPANLAALDEGPPLTATEESMDAASFTDNAVMATLAGSQAIPGESAGSMTRMMLPEGATSPFASMLERPDPSAAPALDFSGALNVYPAGDVRDLVRNAVQTADMDQLREAWRTSASRRTWALELCEGVEREIEAGVLGPFANEWFSGAILVSPRTMMLDVLRGKRWTPMEQAQDAAMLLLVRDMFIKVAEVLPDSQWELLERAPFFPDCVHGFLIGGIRKTV